MPCNIENPSVNQRDMIKEWPASHWFKLFVMDHINGLVHQCTNRNTHMEHLRQASILTVHNE